MALIDLDITIERGRIPDSIDTVLHEANLRTEDYLNHSRVRPGSFVPSDFVCAYYALKADPAEPRTGPIILRMGQRLWSRRVSGFATRV